MIKKSALRKECEELERRRKAISDEIPTEADILDRKERLQNLEGDIKSAETKVGFLTEHIKRLEISESRLTEEVRAEAIRDYKTPVPRAQLRARLAEINDLLMRITDELPAISEFRSDDMEDAIDQLCKDLPEGWIVSLHMEKNAAWVDINDPAGCEINLDTTDESLIDQLISNLEFAKKKSEVD
jgi:septal ring factor EnvC (AmiA/AmiB activator)